MFGGYVFDVEGTLIDCVPENLMCLQEALEKAGIATSYEALQQYSGLDGDQALQLVAPALGADRRKDVLQEKASIYEAKYLKGVKPFRGVRDLFAILKGRGASIALATDCKGPELRHYLKLLRIDEFLDAMACGDDVDHGKPDPRLVGLAVNKLGLAARDAIMVGDTPYDAEAASGAGTPAAGVLTGVFDKDVLIAAGCYLVAQDVEDLITALENYFATVA